MSKQNKFAGNFGKTDHASGGSSVNGNVYKSAPRAGSAPKSSSSVKSNVKRDPISLSGRNNAVVEQNMSSHNNINTFSRGIKSRGPYGGPSFASLNNTKQNYQSKNTSSISKFTNPSGK